MSVHSSYVPLEAYSIHSPTQMEFHFTNTTHSEAASSQENIKGVRMQRRALGSIPVVDRGRPKYTGVYASVSVWDPGVTVAYRSRYWNDPFFDAISHIEAAAKPHNLTATEV